MTGHRGQSVPTGLPTRRCFLCAVSLPERRTDRCSCDALRENGCTASVDLTSRVLSFFGCNMRRQKTEAKGKRMVIGRGIRAEQGHRAQYGHSIERRRP